MSFDFWANRPNAEDPNNWFYKKYGPVMQTEDFSNNTYVNNSHDTCSANGVKRSNPLPFVPSPKGPNENYAGPQLGP